MGGPQFLLGLETDSAGGCTGPRGCAHHGLPISVPSRAWLETGGRASAFLLVVLVACSVLGTWLQLKEAPHPPGLTRPLSAAGGRSSQPGLPGPGLATSRRPGLPLPVPAAPTASSASVWRRKRPICFHSESLKIPFWRNEKRKAHFPRRARWVPARARRRAGRAGAGALLLPTPPRVPHLRPRLGVEGGGLAARICKRRTLAAHLQRRN